MIRFEFAHDDLLRTRFAVSPLLELVHAHQTLADPSRRSLHLPWVRAVGDRARVVRTPMLDALVPLRGYVPDFLQPPPEGPLTDVATELARVREVDGDVVRAEVGWRFEEAGAVPEVLRPLLERPRRGLARLVAEMQELWDAFLAPDWDRIAGVLEDDIAHRARALTAGGAIEVFDDLHPDVRWHAGGLDLDTSHTTTVPLGGRGLQLVPCAFAWPSATAMVDPPWQPALIYPPRGTGLLWEPVGPQADLAELLGARRAEILTGLDRATSTTAVARRLGASAAGVSEHLGVLRRAGLVRARRQGREVLYRRTAAGDALLRAPVGALAPAPAPAPGT